MAYTGGMTVATPWFEQLQRQQATGAISGQQSRDLAYGGAEGAVQAVYAGERTAAQTALQERSVATGERAQANQVSEAAAARSAAPRTRRSGAAHTPPCRRIHRDTACRTATQARGHTFCSCRDYTSAGSPAAP